MIDIAHDVGATVIGVAGSAKKCAFISTRGAEHAIDYTKENVVERVLTLTQGRGTDILFDHVAGKSFSNGLKGASKNSSFCGPVRVCCLTA
jgi:NADPH2:quinone reductase